MHELDKTKYVKHTLREERVKQNKTYEDMAKEMGYKSKSTYMYIENGQTVPTLPVMLRIAQILNKPVEYFFSMQVQDAQTENQSTGTDN